MEFRTNPVTPKRNATAVTTPDHCTRHTDTESLQIFSKSPVTPTKRATSA